MDLTPGKNALPHLSLLYLWMKRASGSSSRTSPSGSVSTVSTGLPSPPATRQRTRKVSADLSTSAPSKGKGKQVGFSREVEVVDLAREEDSDLTDLTELEETVTPSPRRLRSKGDSHPVDDASVRKKVLTRKSKPKVQETVIEDEELVGDTDDERDELLSSPTQSVAEPNGTRGRRTPVKHRLRPRPTQTHTPPSDGDGDDEDEHDTASVEDDQSVNADDEEEEDAEDQATPVKPRRLRNGKVVSAEARAAEEDEILEEEEMPEEDNESVLSESTSDVDAPGETDEEIEDVEEEEEEESDEPMDDDCNYPFFPRDICELTYYTVDLSTATTKTLVRLRRDVLVRLCESRGLDMSGTKAQLAKALRQWRDRPSSESCPSSTGTVRPPETSKPRANGRKKSRSKTDSPVHPPQTPPISNERELEPELELDLESLGLHDREIPPEKITKLEKIGSGGFKDVFVGKLKGRRVAIAEFRGQLNASA